MPKKSFFETVLPGLAVLAVAAGIYCYRDTYPLPGNHGELSKEQVISHCHVLLDSLGIKVEGLDEIVTLDINEKLLAYAQSTFGMPTANNLFTTDLPAYHWRLRYTKPYGLADLLKFSDEEKEAESTLKNYFIGETVAEFDLRGRLLTFTTGFDSAGTKTAGDSITALAMVNLVRSFSPFADDDALNEPRFEKTRGTRFNEYSIGWKPHFATAGVRATIDAKVRSEKLTLWKVEYEPIQSVSTSDKSVHNLTSPFAYIAIVLAIVVFFFRKLRGDRMSFRAGLPAGIVCALASILPFLLSTTHSTIEQLVPILFVPLFFVFSFMMLYAVGESMMRDTGGDYLKTFQALQHRHLLFKPVGESLWYGVLFGALAFGLATFVLYKFGPSAKYYTTALLDEKYHHLSYVPALSLLGGAVSNVVFGETTFRLFASSFFKRYFRSFWVPVVLSAMVAAAAKMHLIWLHPLGMMLAVNFIISVLFSFAYARYDFLSSIVAALTVQALFWGMSLLYIPGLHSAVQASLLLGVPVLFLLGGQVVKHFGSETINVHELEPDYVQRLAERERMTRELEIARQVQVSFLPREKPVIKGLDIASLCVPAQEVGGDYYDFIPFSPTRLGVLIGDVSGKGISAAFYMTLTKGIVKTLVREGLSPAEVLIRANQHFYENAERGNFVSLVFGIFDLQKKEFTFARAGHNPVVIVSSNGNSLQTISPPGIALGLEQGDLFARKMVEKSVPISPGDLFVFYTDGFTEAMNHGKEEFGEPRFSDSVNSSATETSEVVIDRLKNEVKAFSGHVPQHDDMTAIVVKVL